MAAISDKIGHPGGRYSGRLYAYVGEVASIHGLGFVAGLLEHFIHVLAPLISPDKSAHYLLAVGSQPDGRHVGIRQQLTPYSEHRIKDASQDHAFRACRPVVRDHCTDVHGLQPLTIWISSRRREAHVQLIGISESDIDTGLRELVEELPGDRGLADPGRTANPQDRNGAAGHLITAGSAGRMQAAASGPMTEIMAAILSAGIFAGQMLFLRSTSCQAAPPTECAADRQITVTDGQRLPI